VARDDAAPGESGTERQHGPVGTALSTSVAGNSTAFGFSITITVTFGALQALDGSPTLFELLLFGLAAAAAVGVLEAAVTDGFRRRVGSAPAEVRMLGTALNFVSVAAGVGVAIGIGELADGLAVWPVAAFGAAGTYVIVEAAEILLAEGVQRARGDPEADRERD
jgi:hypothetical protein